jgi:hypothetical protein
MIQNFKFLDETVSKKNSQMKRVGCLQISFIVPFPNSTL